MGSPANAAEITERAGHVLAEVSNALGIIVSPPMGKTVLEHARMWLLPDGRVVVVLISSGGNTRDKILRPTRRFSQPELDATAEFLNRHYSGWTLLARQVYVEGTAQMIGAVDFASQGQLRDLLEAIEEKHRLVTVLNACIETPEPVHVQIGVKGISEGGDNLALISAPYTRNDLVQGSLGVLGPTRMHYERAITAVAYVAQLFSEALGKI